MSYFITSLGKTRPPSAKYLRAARIIPWGREGQVVIVVTYWDEVARMGEEVGLGGWRRCSMSA